MCLLNGAFDIFEIGALSIENFTHQGGSLPFCVRVVICTEKPEEIIFHKIKRFELTKKVPVFDCYPLDSHESLVVVPVATPVTEFRNVQLAEKNIKTLVAKCFKLGEKNTPNPQCLKLWGKIHKIQQSLKL